MPSNFTIQVRPDGVWFCFVASNGNQAMLNVEALATRDGVIGRTISLWCKDRHAERLAHEETQTFEAKHIGDF